MLPRNGSGHPLFLDLPSPRSLNGDYEKPAKRIKQKISKAQVARERDNDRSKVFLPERLNIVLQIRSPLSPKTIITVRPSRAAFKSKPRGRPRSGLLLWSGLRVEGSKGLAVVAQDPIGCETLYLLSRRRD